ncbi:MAG: peptidyl-prolyl cis-trans isomerase [Planctomycetota bacterium]
MPAIRRLHSSACAMLVAAAACAAFTSPAGGQGLAEATVPAAASPPNPIDATAPAYVPHVPKAVTRPAGWPGGLAAGNAARHVLSTIRERPDEPLEPISEPQPIPTAAGPGGVEPAQYVESGPGGQAGEVHSLEAALVVARVGPEVVLEADLLTPKALEWLEKVSPGLPPEKVRELRLQICQQVIDQHVETLLVYVDACREIPPDKLPEIRKNVDKAFDEQQLPRMMAEENVANSLEFEQRLRQRGMTLERMRKMFFERGLAQEWLRKNVGGDEEIPHAELIAWYQNHLDEYEFPARARFEVLTVKMGLKRSRAAAWDMLAAMGNEVLGGRPFAEVAKSRSEGPTAAQGGGFDWTNQKSLASKKLDEAIFSLPAGELSAIIEDGEALHIVRVIEREDAGRTPFLDAQVGIREQLVMDRRRQASDDYLAKLRARTPVWTVFEDPTGSAAQPTFTAGRPTTAPH